ncbi:hypothetical protein [Poritiphilus flavus]|uniref:hypothetical protein n=1 Tax=Poritiphilus flavus TaxID=2697053 RepID=UPI00137268A1|nr:hypothetical protein [Poritiphilus flavus]
MTVRFLMIYGVLCMNASSKVIAFGLSEALIQQPTSAWSPIFIMMMIDYIGP